MITATHRWTALLLLAFAPAAFAQTLGDEFIVFVNGTNVLVPETDGQTVNDPLAPTSDNKVAKFNIGSWAHAAFRWAPAAEGVDASGMVGENFGEGRTLYFSILSDPANADQPGISIMLTDKTDYSGASRDDLESGAATADQEFRLLWAIPNEMHDGQWHDVAVQLPPATAAKLEEARTNGDLDGTPAANWSYPGAWSTGGYGIGPGFGTDTSDPLWEEFEWGNLWAMGPFWDHNTGVGGPIYLDNVYFGDESTDVSQAQDPPAAMSGVSFSAETGANLIDWTDQGFGGYNVYFSLEPITDVTAEGVVLLSSLGVGDDTEFGHGYEVLHPSRAGQPLYYAVTSLSGFGVENQDISASSGSVANADLPQKAYIPQLSEAQANDLFDAINAGTVTDAPFEAGHPTFFLDSGHRSPGDGTSVETLPEDNDSSGEFRIGYFSGSGFAEMYVYGEITDDQVTLAGNGTTGADTWNFDSAEVVFGHYDVRTAAGSGGLLAGSPHQDMERGDEPDYGLRFAGHQDASGNFLRISQWIGWSLNIENNAATVYEETATGWRFLTLVDMQGIQNPDEGDVFLPLPASDEIQFIPFILSINDADGETRETQIVWSIKPNVTGQWWNTPAMWETVAIAGSDVTGSVAAEDGTPRDGFALGASRPNPTAGTADIRFSLGSAGAVRLEVFNMLGQRVAMPVDGTFGAGDHTATVDASGLAAGVYVYRLTAGDYVAARRMTVIR